MTIAPEEFKVVKDLVRTNTGINLSDDKLYLVETRLSSLALREGFATASALLNAWIQTKSPKLRESIVQSMTTNETSFFRDVVPFNFLRENVLPSMSKEKKCRIWSAACSSGQEPYSLAIVVCELFGLNFIDRVSIYATDVNSTVVKQASEGRYSNQEVNRGLPANYLVKYFIQKAPYWEIKPELRNSISFESRNLLEKWDEKCRCDVLFCRNVLIYFDEQTRRGLFRKMAEYISPHGYVFLGTAESRGIESEGFIRVEPVAANCYRLK